MAQIFLATTGTPATVVISDLGNITFTHPVLAFPLLIPDGPFTSEEIADSVDLQTAITGSEVILTDQQGNTITDVSTQVTSDDYVKISVDDTTTGFLSEKIAGTGSVIGTILNPGANETLQLNVNATVGIDASDINYDDTAAPVGSPLDGVTDAQAALDALNSQVNTNTGDITAINNSVGQPNGIASLNASGQIPNSQLPDLAISNTVTVADIPARDALGWGASQEGDIAIVTDAGADPNVPSGEAASYIWTGSAFVRLVDGGKVYSVNGFDGVVVLDAGDIGYDNTASGLTATNVQAALDEIDSTVDGLSASSHAAATGSDAIDVTGGQVVSLILDTVTGSGNNQASITVGQGLYVNPQEIQAPFLEFGVRGNQTASTFLRIGYNGDFSNQCPYRLPYDIEVFAVSAFNRLSDTDGWDAEVYINGVINTGFNTTVAATTSSTQNILGSPITITAGQEISARFVLTAAAISRPCINLHYRLVQT